MAESDYFSWVHLFEGFPNWITMVLKRESDNCAIVFIIFAFLVSEEI